MWRTLQRRGKGVEGANLLILLSSISPRHFLSQPKTTGWTPAIGAEVPGVLWPVLEFFFLVVV